MDEFIVYPAIDLRQGQVVRLKQGDPSRKTIFGDDPAAVARRWMAAGAVWLHVVNLDGAFGEVDAANREALQAILGTGAKVQLGGGLRSLEAVQMALDLGVRRVVIGTAAVENPELICQVVSKFGSEHLAIGVDTREGRVHTRGWVDDTGDDDCFTSCTNRLPIQRAFTIKNLIRYIENDIIAKRCKRHFSGI